MGSVIHTGKISRCVEKKYTGRLKRGIIEI